MDDAFDVEHLHRVVDAALRVGSPSTARPNPTPAVAPPGVDPVALPLAWGDSQVLAQVMHVLADHLSADELSAVVAETRAHLVAGMAARTVPELHTVVKHCRRCPASGGPHLPVGNVVDPTVVFVHELPVQLHSFEATVQSALDNAGLTATTTVHTSLVRCRVDDLSAASTQCASYLFAELQAWQPKLVILCGAAVNAAILGVRKITAERGQIHWLGLWPFLPIYSFAHAQRTEENFQLWHADVRTAQQFVGATASD